MVSEQGIFHNLFTIVLLNTIKIITLQAVVLFTLNNDG